jgi:hypothetical protein
MYMHIHAHTFGNQKSMHTNFRMNSAHTLLVHAHTDTSTHILTQKAKTPIYIYICICICIYIYTHTHAYTDIHTHTHTSLKKTTIRQIPCEQRAHTYESDKGISHHGDSSSSGWF